MAFPYNGTDAVAIGTLAGSTSQGTNSIAIGKSAGQTSQAANSIALNATGVALNPANTGFFVDPIRQVDPPNIIGINTTTKEITYLANGTSGQVLTSQGAALAPTWTTPASAGATLNSASQVYSDDFVGNPFNSVLLDRNYPFNLLAINSNLSNLQTTFPERPGVWRATSSGNTSMYVVSQSLWSARQFSTDSTGLGFTVLMYPSALTAGQKAWVGFNNSYNVSPLPNVPAINVQFLWDTRNANWGCQIGDSAVQYFSPATGNLALKWCSFRMYPNTAQTGWTFTLRNIDDNITYTPITILYSQQVTPTITNTTLMTMGAGVYNSAITIDYYGIQVSPQRIF